MNISISIQKFDKCLVMWTTEPIFCISDIVPGPDLGVNTLLNMQILYDFTGSSMVEKYNHDELNKNVLR